MIRGMVSMYKISKMLNVNFRICFTVPFCLDEYLTPNRYNWLMPASDIIFNKYFSLPCYIHGLETYEINNSKDWIRWKMKKYSKKGIGKFMS
jgi:hypothetical protein